VYEGRAWYQSKREAIPFVASSWRDMGGALGGAGGVIVSEEEIKGAADGRRASGGRGFFVVVVRWFD